MNRPKRFFPGIALFFVFIIPSLVSTSQTDSTKVAANPNTMTVAANPNFKNNGSKRFWMGANYRAEWTTPITVPVINMSTEKGGLTPVKRGGGKQTKSLRVEDPEGRQYSFRSIQKFITGKTLPYDLQSEAAEDLVADGVSASYPYAALSVVPLSTAAGIPTLDVKVIYIPDDPKLGEHREDFKNLLAYLEDRLPDSVKKGSDTEELVEKLVEDNDNEVDQHALLKARILDMFIMDFDRHEDQWQWGAVDKDKGKLYYPIPRDRDQAFFINRGLIPGIIKWPWVVPQLQGFDEQAKNINRFNFAARNFDRFFLNELSEQDWQKAVDEFIPKMTDEVIQEAINRQPPEVRPVSGELLVNILKGRRQHLAGEVMRYYRFLAEIVSISGSDKKELFDITRGTDGSVDLKVYKITKEGEQSTLMYERKFDAQITEELRLYGLGGDDKFVVKGTEDKIKLRLIGGDGEDNFEAIDNNNGGIVYDMKSGNNKLNGDFRNKMANDTLVNKYNRLDYMYNQKIPFVSVNYNRDDGVFLGLSLKFINHGFRKEPYKNSHEFAINHALATKAWEFRYAAEYIGAFGKKTDLLTYMAIKAPNNTTNFFGYGDDTFYDKTKPGEYRYYRSRYKTGDLAVLLRKRFSEKVVFTFGPAFQYYSMDSADNVGKFIVTDNTGLDKNTLFAKQYYLGGRYSFIADTRNNLVLPTSGIHLRLTGRHLAGVNDISYNFTQLNGDFTFHIPIIAKTLILANRVGGGHNFGNFEFYQAQYLGSEDNIRGYRKNRFAGRSKIYNNTELRLRLLTFKTYLFPGYLGVFGFYDTGKLWADGSETSNRWISGYGGGIWLAPLRRIVLTLSYTASKEDTLPLFSFGWKF